MSQLLSLLPKAAECDWVEFSYSQNPRATVVVICGFGATRRSVSALRRRLLKDHYDVVLLALQLQRSGPLGMKQMARGVRDMILDLSQRPGPVFVIAHSAGGLIARHFMQSLEGHQLCKGFVTLATPHLGCWVPLLGFVTQLVFRARVLWQMLPISRFIHELNNVPLTADVSVLAIRSRADKICPTRSTELPASWKKAENVKFVELKGLSHMDFLTSKACYNVVVEFLGEHLKVEAKHSKSKHAESSAV